MDISRWNRWNSAEGMWRTIDVIAYVLLIIGALNLGVAGLLGFDLVVSLVGEMTAPVRILYGFVGIAALYDLLSLPLIFRRWEIRLHHRPAQA